MEQAKAMGKSAAQENSSSRHPMSNVRARIIDAQRKAVSEVADTRQLNGLHSSLCEIASLAAASTALVIAKEIIQRPIGNYDYVSSANDAMDDGLRWATKQIDALLADLLVERPPRQESDQW